MQSTTEVLFDKLELLYENVFNLLTGFQQASTSNTNITVPIKNSDGTINQVSINSFQNLQQELTRIDANFKSLTNADNLSYTLESDGSISQQTKTSFINAEYLENFIIGDTCVADMVSHIDDLVFPNVKIPITINSTLRSNIYCKIFEINEGWENIGNNPTILDIDYLNQNGKISYKEINRTLELEKTQINYFGKFTIETLTTISPNNYKIIINDVKYTGINTIGNSIDLKVNDILVSKTGASKYNITYIDKFSKILNITRIAGSENLSIGIDKLYFNETLTDNSNIVGIPIRPAQNIVVFLSTENFKNISFPSIGIKIDTTNYKIIYQNTTYTLDEFFSNYVTNFSEYLSALMNETLIPFNLGIIPTKPVLNISNFKVIQINKHLNDTKSLSDIDTLNKSKQVIQNDIDFKQSTINQYQSDIDTLNYISVADKNYKLSQIVSLKQAINIAKTNLLNIAQDIDTTATKDGLKNITPKYKVIGFWDIQNPIYSPLTSPQNIIKYEVNYRYLSQSADTVDNTSYSMVSDTGKSVTVAFSSWNDLQTQVLNKIQDVNGKLVWEIKATDSVDTININQLAITINENESIEIKIRAISEAGYPISPLKSEWSENLRIDFPSDLKSSDISSTINQNTIDLNKAKFDGILQDYGLLDHISGTIKDGDKTFFHQAKDVASGQYTPEQKNIPLDTIIATLVQEINDLKSSELSNVNIKLIDFDNESFTVTNNSTMDLFAGNYNDNINILDVTKWGAIIRKKGYIKISNNNLVPIELKTLIPGQQIFSEITAPYYYNVPTQNENRYDQVIKQILYFRNIDVTNQITDTFKLLKPALSNSQTYPNDLDIDINAVDSLKNIIYFNQNSSVNICKLIDIYSTNFVAFTKDHPLYDSSNLNLMLPEFDRLKLYTQNIKALQYQTALVFDVDPITQNVKVSDNNIVGFDDNDFYAIGQPTCGAFLYPIINKISTIQVVGDSTSSTLIIPQQSEILIPFVYEYRMIDRLGHIDGILNYDTTTELQYSKKIGIDILINNQTFKFDINVSSKLKSKIKTADSLNISSITSVYTGESQTTLT